MKRSIRLAASVGVSLTLATVAVFLAVSPVSASPAEALGRCQQGLPPNFTTNVAVSQQSGIYGYRDQVWPGDVFRVSATGGIKTDGWPWTPYFSADGVNDIAWGPYWPAEGRKKMSLVGIWNDVIVDYNTPAPRGNTVQLGTNTGCVQYNGTSRTFLWLVINDNYILDNNGSWNVVIRHYWA